MKVLKNDIINPQHEIPISDEPVTLPEETIRAVRELGEILREIYNGKISEGYILKDGKFIKTNGETTNPTE
jgi:hypothetical protein